MKKAADINGLEKKKTRVLPLALTLVAATVLSDNQKQTLPADLLIKAREQSAETVRECRKSDWLNKNTRLAVRCLLNESSLSFQRANLKKNTPVQFQMTGNTVDLGGERFNIGMPEEKGVLLIAPNNTVYLVADLRNTIENVRAVLKAKKGR